MKKIATSKYVFVNPKTNTRYGVITKGLKTILKKYNIYRKGIGSHIYRHNFATKLDEQGTQMTVIQELLGHSTIMQTKEYIEVDKKRKFYAVNLKAGCDVTQQNNIVKFQRKNKQEYKILIDQYLEYVKNAHQMPIKKNFIQKKTLKKRA